MTLATPNHIVRPAKDLDEVQDLYWPLMQELGWNRAKEDCKTHYTVSKSWLLIFPESCKTPQGMLLPLIYPNKTAWVAFFIMNAAYRGKGLGAALWREMETLVSAAQCSFIGLDAVPEQVQTYTRRGFVDCARVPLMSRKSLVEKPLGIKWGYEDAVELQDLRDVDPVYLTQLDLEHTGLDRRAYWAADVLPARRDAFGYTIVEDGELTGLIYARRCPDGVRIGPLYAATYVQARQLLHKLMNDYARMEGTFAAEIFGTNVEGRKLFEELGWEYAGVSYHRMWKDGNVPEEQKEGSMGATGMYATFDAASG
ncbi:hypothetical protein HBI56_101500 [Parastagonospora nodorum]|nr:hypothetical protein HBH53_179120 [Parastagonospora nodorum]KAH3959262.1 hypothetical protein HBH51_201470 [Parastagonospora nodorum]KAH4006260.1 hypothetical protein HBI10_022570 [Parastagonospora nodorum]KAH4011944.1 hypothetical protein HBI13_192930 [Parastagonospora nodorum]KAH4212704.1 hypothetical protein HBI95_040840 [Parastagonospora nodorum]